MTRKLGLDRMIQRSLHDLVEDGTIDGVDVGAGQVADAVIEAVKGMAAKATQRLRETMGSTLAEHREIRRGFEERLQDLWGPATDALEAVMIASFEAGEQVFKEDRRVAAGDAQFQALVALHVRACLVTSEILALLRSGHASGAHARWRTLHEIAVVALFLKEHDRATAERYLIHADVGAVERLEAYQQHAERLGEVKLSPEEERAVRHRRDAILAAMPNPKGFTSPWGWAGPTLGVSRPTFRQIQDAVHLDHWRPWVNIANFPVHAGIAGTKFDMGNDGGLLLAGASNAGLADSGHSTAISLQLATVALLLHRLNWDRVLYAITIAGLVEDVGEAFAAAEAEYARRKAAVTRRRDRGLARRRSTVRPPGSRP